MKFWQKIYVFSLAIFILIFNLSGIIIIEKNHSQMLKKEVNRSLDEDLGIYLGLNGSRSFLKSFESFMDITELNNKVLEDFAKNYLKSSSKDTYIEILDSNKKKVFSNINFKLPKDRIETKSNNPRERNYIIRDVNEKTLLFVTNSMNISNEHYKINYIKDISYVYNLRKDQYIFFVKLDLVVCLIFAVFMMFVSKYITKPINVIIDTTKKISNGDLSKRVEISSKDEMGVLAQNFNSMTDTIENTVEELKNVNSEKQIFIDNFSHEIKTPLTSIIGYSSLLRTTKYNEKTFSECLDMVYKEGRRLENLSFNLMKLVNLRNDDFDMKKENLKNILNYVVEITEPKIKAKNINLHVKFKDAYVIVEKQLIIMLITNFLDNAIKACEENGNIYLRITTNEDNIILEIKDDGIGIPKEHLHKVKEPFYMVDKSRSRKDNGAGLGLSICHKIMEVHKAKFDIQSKVNEGTTIKVFFNHNL